MPKNKDGSVSMTLQFPVNTYCYLKKIAELDRRSMTQEVFFLIEQAAKKMKAEYEDGPILTHDPVPTYGHEVKVIRPREFDNNVSSISYDIVYTPFYGQTAAGKPISFDTLPGLVVPWAKEMIKGDPSRYFTVLVKGSSMTEAGIEDGDYALLRRAEAPRPNRIMLIRHGDESTLKRIKMKGDQEVYMCWEDGTDKEPIRLDDQDYEIQGEYVGILRGKLG